MKFSVKYMVTINGSCKEDVIERIIKLNDIKNNIKSSIEQLNIDFVEIDEMIDYEGLQRSQEEIKKDYEEACKNDNMVQDSVYKNIYKYENQDLRDKLVEEYEHTYPEDKQLAIYLHKRLCKRSHTDQCFWNYAINGVEHDWNEYSHKEYLEKARRCIKNGVTKEMIDLVLNSIYN